MCDTSCTCIYVYTVFMCFVRDTYSNCYFLLLLLFLHWFQFLSITVTNNEHTHTHIVCCYYYHRLVTFSCSLYPMSLERLVVSPGTYPMWLDETPLCLRTYRIDWTGSIRQEWVGSTSLSSLSNWTRLFSRLTLLHRLSSWWTSVTPFVQLWACLGMHECTSACIFNEGDSKCYYWLQAHACDVYWVVWLLDTKIWLEFEPVLCGGFVFTRKLGIKTIILLIIIILIWLSYILYREQQILLMTLTLL